MPVSQCAGVSPLTAFSPYTLTVYYKSSHTLLPNRLFFFFPPHVGSLFFLGFGGGFLDLFAILGSVRGIFLRLVPVRFFFVAHSSVEAHTFRLLAIYVVGPGIASVVLGPDIDARVLSLLGLRLFFSVVLGHGQLCWQSCFFSRFFFWVPAQLIRSGQRLVRRAVCSLFRPPFSEAVTLFSRDKTFPPAGVVCIGQFTYSRDSFFG